ncbi:hypothetical protein FNH22_20930 [Fulvivirga sp. M361]|uniref:endo-beta-N-acetylglucosaminidase n=1 Tax=Fulvivirga sp. M361 TaxID=2594266 RepID=UPI00117ACD05|nr:hypothetical protein [Fulvivirga sp. M361]TRX53363.1 hypothetical protein FNH22_20930 [Fulvivirga sp. M361]
MNLRSFFTILFFLSLDGVFAQTDYGEHQPYSSYWFVDELLKWDKDNDPYAKFNVSHTPLAERFTDPKTQRNPELSVDPSITSLVASYPTSNHPSQGFQTVQQYAFPYWQYIDYFVQWGGAAQEGIIVTPAVPWIDAAHRNGVKILGTVFFPPVVYGGKKEWVIEMLQKDDNGNFPVADKLLEVAAYYGFDGWFINQETDGLSQEDARNMQGFLAYYQQKARERFQLMWYDAMIEDGRVIWQEELNHHNSMYFQQGDKKMSDIMFIDFGWSATQLEDTHKKALELDRSPWQLYSGVDVQKRGYKSYVKWGNLYKDDAPYTTSIGLYWPNATFDLAEDKQPETVYREEKKFWNGTFIKQKIGHLDGWEWKGFANYFPARSTINNIPFITHFNYGLGRFYNEEGKQLFEKEWHNLSSQDILPSWQWDVDTTLVKITFDFNESYTGGSSLRMDIQKGEKEVYIPLYKSNLQLTGNEKFELAAKGAVAIKLSFDFSDGTSRDYPVALGAEWGLFSGLLDNAASRKVVKIGVKVSGKDMDTVYLGKLSIVNKRQAGISRPEISTETFQNGDQAEMYVHIKGADNSAYHSIYQLARDGSRTWLGQTNSTYYYVPVIEKESHRKYTMIQVVSTAKDGSRSKAALQKVYWK